MKTRDEIALIGPCGIYCGECECHKAKNNPPLLEYLVSRGINKDRLPCQGCRAVEGNCPVIGSVCETYACAIEKGVDFCHECQEFPCARLNPSSDRANILPHNLKVFNLCYIKHQGLAKFIEKAPEIKLKYYKGKMVIGKGPQIE